jgi:hypothetical protein
MISVQKRFLFVHVPKTGGNSIQNILRHYSEDHVVALFPNQDGIERFEVRNARYDITKHSTLAHYKSVLDADTFRSLYKFTALRNPWDMMVSYYFSPFRGVVEWNRNNFLALAHNVAPLRHFVCEQPEAGRALDSDVDFLMRFERLDQDFEAVCRKLGIPYAPLPRRNSSDRGHYSKYYDEELKAFIGRKFSEEIEFGGYRFEQA